MSEPRPRTKPRDPRGERPRDELGRPLPWGSESKLALLDYDALSPAEDHRLGIDYFNRGDFFPAHEAWESAWRQLRGTPDEEFFKGLAQLAAGYTHYLRGNPSGAATLIDRGSGRVARYGAEHHGIDGVTLRAVCEDQAALLSQAAREGKPPPGLTPPML